MLRDFLDVRLMYIYSFICINIHFRRVTAKLDVRNDVLHALIFHYYVI